MGPVRGHQCPYDAPSVAEHFRKTGTVNLNPADILLFRDSLGLVFCIVGLCLPIYAVIYSSLQPDLDLVLFTIQMLSSLSLMSFGGSILFSGLAPNVPENDQGIALRKAVMPLMVILIVGYSIWAASEFSSTIGEVDAWNTWAKAPQAKIELASPSTHDALSHGSDECDTDSLRCHFRVILTGENFVYLRPLDLESSEERLYAVPIGDIVSIAYISD